MKLDPPMLTSTIYKNYREKVSDKLTVEQSVVSSTKDVNGNILKLKNDKTIDKDLGLRPKDMP